MPPTVAPKILCFGEVTWDRSWLLSQIPKSGIDGELMDQSEGPGGSAFNSACTLASGGIPIVLGGNFIGQDSWGEAILGTLAQLGIENHLKARSRYSTPSNICLLDYSSGQRAFIVAHEGMQDWSSDLTDGLIEELRNLKFSHVFVQSYFREGARRIMASIPDSAWSLTQDLAVDSEFVGLTRALQLSLDESIQYSDQDISQLTNQYFRQKLEEIFLTHGKHGVWYQRRGNVPKFYPTVSVDKVVDSTGCGDAFRAGLMMQLYLGNSIDTAIRYGQKLGALKSQNRGSYLLISEHSL